MATADDLNSTTFDLRKQAHDIAAAKRPVYTNNNGDVLWNFKTIARMTGLTVGEVMAVYMSKQLLSVVSSLRSDAPIDPESATRIADSLNYLELINVAQTMGEDKSRG